jgi:hypothetical protein
MSGSENTPSTGGGHLGDAQFNRFVAGTDRVLGEAWDALMTMSPIKSGLNAMMSDSLLGGVAEVLNFDHEAPPLAQGRVVEAIPFVNFYKVQVDRMDINLRCSLGDVGSYQPTGVSSSTVIPVGSQVAVWRIANSNKGVILGVIPYEQYTSDFTRPDWIQQGSNTGFKREPAHYENLKIFAEEGGVQDFNNNRPLDQTAQGEFSKFNMHGGAFFLDDFQAYMRVSEVCGIFANWYDNYLRVAGLQMDMQTGGYNLMSRLDEGETFSEHGSPVYPWEGYGAYADGTSFTKEFSDKDVQYEKPVGKIDEEGADDIIEILPVYRYKEFGGYVGQGRRHITMRPRKLTPGLEKLSTSGNPPEYTLFETNTGLDGMYMLRSSKSIHIVKRLPGPHPKRLKMPADQEGGKNDNTDTYKFSGKIGSGENHEVGDVDNKPDDLLSLKQGAGAKDLHTYIYNFKNLHPFHYHTKDYETPEESKISPHDQVTDKLDFGTLGGKMYMNDPEPGGKIEIDHRYGEVNYYKRESYLSMLDEGTVILGCGYGSEIRMVYGHMFLTAPAAKKDVRIKSQINMEFVAANEGTGGTIIENRANSYGHKYPKDKPGEDVRGSGVLVRCPRSQFFSWACQIYLRTGNSSGGIEEDDICLDASKTNTCITMISNEENHFIKTVYNRFFGLRVGEYDWKTLNADCIYGNAKYWSSGPPGFHWFNGGQCVVNGGVMVEEGLTLVKGTGTHFTGEHWGELKDTPQYEKNLQAIRECKKALEDCLKTGDPKWISKVKKKFYEPGKIGHAVLQKEKEFSFRDDDGKQYCSTDFRLAEARWQMYSRFGIGDGVSSWDEKTVTYQGKPLAPYPGKKKWFDEPTFKQLKELTMFDCGTLRSKDRRLDPETTAQEYIDRVIETWKKPSVPPNGKYQVIK